MAGRIAGITIEIGGDTTKLQSSLKAVDGQLRKTQTALKDINKLLKLDPGNTELLRQKQKQLQEAINKTKERLKQLREAQGQVAEGTPEWDALQREIIATEQDLRSLQNEYRSFGSVSAQVIKAAGEKMEALGNKVSAAGRSLMPLSRTAAAIGTGLLGLGYKALQTADDLETLSQQTGLTTDEIQGMEYASELVDVSFESMSGALKKMKKNMTGQADTWKQLGISVTDADGNMRDATDVFYESLTALSQIENETERDQLAMNLFGKSADELAGIIDDGGESLKKYSKQAKDLGLVMDEETISAMSSLNDTVDELKANFGATLIQLGASLATTLAPALTTISEKLQAFAEKIRNLTPEQTALILKITGIVAAIAPLLVIGGKLITGIGKLMQLAPLISTAFSALTSPVGLVVAGIAAAIAVGVLLYKNWDKIKAKAIELKDNVVAAWQNLKASTLEAWEALKSDISAAWDNIKANAASKVAAIKTSVVNTFNSLKSSVTNIFNSLKSSVINIVNGLKSSVINIVNSLKSSLAGAWSGVKSTALSAFNGLKSGVINVLDSIKSKAQAIVDAIKRIFTFKINLPTIGGGIMQKYASAYHNPVVFTQPTVLATPSGYKQFGDGNGAEVVMGLNKLRELVSSTSGGGVIINVYPSQGMDVNQLADQIQARFVALQKQRSLAYA